MPIGVRSLLEAEPRETAAEPAPPSYHWFDNSAAYADLVSEFTATGSPVTVNFRKLVPLHSGIDRATHLLHSYPAKLLLNIPLFFLGCRQFGPPGTLYDPFCGSGTTLVEGAIRGWRLAGADSNPLARKITKAKLTYIDPKLIAEALVRIEAASAMQPATFAPVVDVNMWFSERAKVQIGSLLDIVARLTDGDIREFFEVCISACLRKASFADPRLSVPVRLKSGTPAWEKASNLDIVDLFRRTVVANARRIQSLGELKAARLDCIDIANDARMAGPNDVDLIITSPPYVGAQKYVRASTLSIGWLKLAPDDKLRALERVSIGREHFTRPEYLAASYSDDEVAAPALRRIHGINPLRAHIAAIYLREMNAALKAAVTRLKPGGRAVLVIGNNTICGEEFETSRYLAEICRSLGLVLELELLDDIRSRGLMTKRNKTAGVIRREHIQVYRVQP